MNRHLVYLKDIKRSKYEGKNLSQMFARYVLLEKYENGDCRCAINNDHEKQIVIQAEDIEEIRRTILIKAKDGNIYECGGFSNYEGLIRTRTPEGTDVELAIYRSWGYTDDVARKIRKLHNQGALYCELPKVERSSYFESVMAHQLNPQFDPDIASNMVNWEIEDQPEWLWRIRFIVSRHKQIPNMIRVTATHATSGWGNFLRYEGNDSEFNQTEFVRVSKEYRDRIDAKKVDDDLYESLFSDPNDSCIRGKFREVLFQPKENNVIKMIESCPCCKSKNVGKRISKETVSLVYDNCCNDCGCLFNDEDDYLNP